VFSGPERVRNSSETQATSLPSAGKSFTIQDTVKGKSIVWDLCGVFSFIWGVFLFSKIWLILSNINYIEFCLESFYLR